MRKKLALLLAVCLLLICASGCLKQQRNRTLNSFYNGTCNTQQQPRLQISKCKDYIFTVCLGWLGNIRQIPWRVRGN